MTEKRLTARDLRKLLAVRYPVPEWLLCEEAGGVFGRRVDVVAFNLWASRGHRLEGFELKVERRDWLAELKNPAKAEESLYRYCDAWWVLSAEGVVRAEEVPVPWGWIEQKGDRLYTRKKAPTLDAKPVTRVVLAALLKRYEARDASAELAWRQSLRDEITAQVKDRFEEALALEQTRITEMRERLRRYERLYGWSDGNPDAERAVALARRLVGRQGVLPNLEYATRGLKHAVDALRELAEFQQGLETTEAGERETHQQGAAPDR